MDIKRNQDEGPSGTDQSPIDGVSKTELPSTLARQPVNEFIEKLNSVGDGLEILSELLDALRDVPRSSLPASRLPLERSKQPQRTKQERPTSLSQHRTALKDHQELFSLLRRIAQREISQDNAERETQSQQSQSLAPPAVRSTPTLFLGKLNVPSVSHDYRTYQRR